MYKNVIAALALALLAAACANQDVKEQSKAATVEKRDLTEEQRKRDEAARAQIAREQEERDRRLEEERRKAEEEVKIQALPPTSMTEGLATDLRSQLRDPSSPLYKRTIFYGFDQYEIDGDNRAIVEAHARFLEQNPDVKIRVEGNCDERGSTEYNLALGQRRADGVKRALTLLGVGASRIEAVSYGEEKPKGMGQDEEAYALNRRSDIVYPGYE